MEKQLNDLIDASCTDYLKSFQDLKNYYYRHKLLEQGVVFIPLFDGWSVQIIRNSLKEC